MKTKYLVPVAAIAATWVARRGLESGYRRAFGSEPPTAENGEARLAAIVVWAAATAATIAVVEVLVSRALEDRTV